MTEKKTNFLLILACGISGGSIASFAKIALESMNSGTLTMIRYALALLFLLIIFARSTNWSNVRRSLKVSILLAVNAITFAIAIRYLKASAAPLLYNVVPLMVALLSLAILKERLNRNKIVGLVVGFSGVVLVAFAPSFETSISLLGVSLIMLGSLTFALFSVLSKPLQDRIKPSEMLIGISIVTLVFQAFYMLLIHEPLTLTEISARSWLAATEVALVGTLLFYGLYQYIIKTSGPVSASLMVYVQPAAGAIWAWVLLNDHLSFLALVGGLIALLGIAQVNGLWSELSRKYLRR